MSIKERCDHSLDLGSVWPEGPPSQWVNGRVRDRDSFGIMIWYLLLDLQSSKFKSVIALLKILV